MTLQTYYQQIADALSNIQWRDRNRVILPALGETLAINFLLDIKTEDKKVMMIGNGASASIASHMAADYSKAGKIRSQAFNDHALLTCLSNDFSYQDVFQKAIEIYAQSGDMLIAISSSGRSQNILSAARAAHEKGCRIITLSGGDPDNPLLRLGDCNIYVPGSFYGTIELAHATILHYILDTIAPNHIRRMK
ncbi:SIS domain-containing protein [Candidatus Parcubacteria bacterium]|nr:SIS domain-containing protein [Candidatus Parcubacteria bacterium]